MAESKLRQLLHDLDVELQKTSGLDERQRQHIAAIRQEVEAVLAELGSPTKGQQNPGRKARIGEALALFETSHPNLTLILEQVIDTLAGMGL
ncbi:hypothetical protein ACVW0Q_002642 [Thermostichus sp. MS-CIW-21]|jgi:hypothetical protein|uniref:DUF4404 family protein n=1 Tax=unclassified Synechococcus TaxID=2626047 RepID=UPI00031D89F2|nr:MULTISPECIES: DUF4404 family protein [unclassified Synechococcus]PIK84493.1 hypothetical protein SYN65AY6A5_11705 [Synechococcus sp. 65AY6A5]